MRAACPASSPRITWSCRPAALQYARRAPGTLVHCASTASPVEAELISLLKKLEAQHNGLTEEAVLEQVSVIEEISANHGLNKIVPEYIAGYFNAAALNGYLKMATSNDSNLTLGALTVMSVQPADRKVSYNKAARPRSLWRGKAGGADTYIIPSNISVDGMDLKATSEAIMGYNIDPENPCAFQVCLKEARVTPELDEGKEEEQLQQWLDLVAEPNQGNSVDRTTGVVHAQIATPIIAGVNVLVNLPGWHLIRASNGSCSLFRRVPGKYADE